MPDRDKVIGHLNDCMEASRRDNTWVFVRKDIVEDAISLLNEQEWNLLTEDDDRIIHGLPGDDGQYLMTDGRDIWIDDYVDGVADGIILDSGRDIREITAWMYMPELPKKDRR